MAWKTPIPGRGWSSPIVRGDRVFVTSVVAEEDYQGPRPSLYLPETGNETPPDPPPGTHHWMVFCLDLETGALVWQRTAHSGIVAFDHSKNEQLRVVGALVDGGVGDLAVEVGFPQVRMLSGVAARGRSW